MERILLINPGQVYYKKTFRTCWPGSIGLPLGMLYAAAALERERCRVKVLDCLVSDHTILEKRGDHFFYGIPDNKLRTLVKEYKPDIVAIGSQFMTQEENVSRTAKLVKDIDTSIQVIVGGANTGCRYKYLLEQGDIDIAIKGESEQAISNLIKYFRGNIKLESISGIAYRRENQVCETVGPEYIDNLDGLPLPAYHLVDMEAYFNLYKKGVYARDRNVKRVIPMVTSRGCPYRCIFCSVSHSMGKRWRAHSAEYTSRHIIAVSKRYNVRHIHFEDDNLLMDIKRFMAILDTLNKESITWDTPNGIRVDPRIDEDILKRFKQCGCKYLTIGIESGDQEVLDRVIKKDITLEDVTAFAKKCKRIGLPLRAFFILGFPGETIESMYKTVAFACFILKKYNVEIINHIATPIFGTELYDICRDNDYFASEVSPRTLSESTVPDGHCLIRTETFTAKDVESLSNSLTRKVYRRLFIRGLRYPLSSLRRIGNTYMFIRALRWLV
ncbi:MAG: radical SAM protein [Candidatus Omnitrophica bacterium]|nr:radical SAM protein [Candidatus Omnitrophota bacterium]